MNSAVNRSLLACCLLLPTTAHSDAVSQRYSAQIIRTTHGIPHITAKDEASAAYGVGYAYAQDNLCLMLEEVLTVNGQRSLHFGGDAVNGPELDSGSIRSTNLQSDFFFKLLSDPETTDAAWRSQPVEIKAAISGYVAGFNRQLHERQQTARMPTACAKAPWVRDITPLDVMKLQRRYAAEASIRFLDALVNAAPPSSVRTTTASFPVAEDREPALGSNAVAYGKDLSANGRGMLLANPHFPWYGSLRLYQMHLTVPGSLDVMGASLGGLPFVSIGFTRELAWTHTVNTSSHYTLHALELDPSSPTKYVVDGETRELRKRQVAVEVRDASGQIKTVTHDFWLSEYGPVVHRPGRLEWNSKTAYALQDANIGNARLLQVTRAMNRSRSLAELESAMKSALGLPWVNTIAVDREGTAMYANLTVIPNVSDAQLQQCVPETFRPLLSAGKFVMIVLDGSKSACNWKPAATTVQAGIMPADALPVLRRTDFVQNSNDSAWLTNPAQPLTHYPAIVSGSAYPQNGRTRLGIDQILAHKGRLTPDDIKATVLSNRSYYGPMLLQSLDAVCGNGAPAEIEDACHALRRWDGTAELHSIAYALAQGWLRDLKKEITIWRVPFNPADPVNTPRDIDVRRPEALRLAREALTHAAQQLQNQGIALDATWGSIQVATAANGSSPVHGGDADDIYNVIDGTFANGRKLVNTGTSYLAVVRFEAQGPLVDAMLTYSQSTDPDSPYYTDQLPRFGAKQWLRLPFAPKHIARDAVGVAVTIQE